MVNRSRPHRRSWTRELIELAALFLAVAVADGFANSLAHQPSGSVVLTGLGVLTIVCVLVHRWSRHRPARRAPQPGNAAPGSVWRVRTTVRDTPGSLASLTASLAAHRMNILSVQVHTLPRQAVDEFLVQTRGTAAEIVAAVEAGGGWDITTEPADPHDLVDIPARVLTLVSHTVGADLPRTMRALLGDCEVRWQSAGKPSEGPDGTTLRLTDPEGGLLTISRSAPDFTPAEFARARALVDLHRSLGARIRSGPATILLSAGVELTVRQADTGDIPAILAMHDRCTGQSRRQRYLSPVGRPTTADLTRMVHPNSGHTLIVERPDGDVTTIIAMANLLWDGDAAEVALLVEDTWQRHGIGTAMLHRLTGIAATTTDRPTRAVTELTNTTMMRILHRAGAEIDRIENGLAHLTITGHKPVPR